MLLSGNWPGELVVKTPKPRSVALPPGQGGKPVAVFRKRKPRNSDLYLEVPGLVTKSRTHGGHGWRVYRYCWIGRVFAEGTGSGGLEGWLGR